MPPQVRESQVFKEKEEALVDRTHPSLVPSTPNGFYFLSSSAIEKLPNYNYQGQDNSLLYQYILSPLAAWCVNHLTPKTMAPNTITLLGLSLMITAYASVWYYAPLLEPIDDASTPRWIFLWNGIAMLLYQTLDNMDGKQARRTSSSSPLGLIFDHGCDAVNSVFGSANWIVAMGLNPSVDKLGCWALLMGPFALFYIATWEQYHTGKLILPIFNGPNEGLLGGALLHFTSYVWGVPFWQTPFYRSWTPADCMLAVSCFGFVQEVILKTYSVVRTYGTRAVLALLPFGTLLVCTYIIGLVDANIWLDMPRTTLHLSSGLFVEMSTELMMAHCTSQSFLATRRWMLLPLVGLTLAVVLGLASAGTQVQQFLLCYTSMVWAVWGLKMVICIHEMCAVLNIWCFDICTPRPHRMRVVVKTE